MDRLKALRGASLTSWTTEAADFQAFHIFQRLDDPPERVHVDFTSIIEIDMLSTLKLHLFYIVNKNFKTRLRLLVCVCIFVSLARMESWPLSLYSPSHLFSPHPH